MNLEYRKVDPSDLSEMKFIAEQDSKIPLQYDPDCTWNKKSIDARLEYYGRVKKEDFFEVTVYDHKIVGFHLILKIPYPPDLWIGSIATLWVDPVLRGMGIGSELKLRGEQWARSQGLSFLQTGVHPSNSIMMELNKKNGYNIIQYNLRKKL